MALLLSLAVGRFASGHGIPRVTVYLLVGLFLGPHIGLAWAEPDGILAQFMLGPDTEVPLRVLQELGVGFILFSIGAAFRFPIFREVGPRILGISGAEIGLTSVLVGGAVYLATGDWRLGVIAPALAVASAPSATLVTLREVEAEGPTSRCLMLCVGHNNLVALIAYPVLASLAFGVGGAGGATLSALIALAGGGAIGFAAAVWLESITGRRELVLLGILVVLATLGIAHWGEVGGTGLGMLACFAAGLAIANGSPHSDELFRYLENTVYPIYVLFFIAAGRDLHLDAIAQGGLLAVLFIAARTAGKIYGSRIGMRLTGLSDSLPRSLGSGLLCQAGIALGLVASLEQIAPTETAHLRHVVVASVVIFELIGPFLVRHVVVRAGEVTLANLLPHAEAKGTEALRWVYLEFRRNLGLLKDDSDSDNKTTVEHAMRRRPRFVSESLSFERVLKALGETGADLLPVIDHEAYFKGVISYEEVKNTLYDPFLRGLVIAEDLTSSVDDALDPDASLAKALEVLDRHRVQSWPVVKDRQLLGIVRRTDIYAMMRRS
ncbi:MAG: cation:proton antiporter [Deltaproteobacteria bacterium]|nr:cation:proton antiporter [Deltaproteobacteria bacterium]MBW2691292.1 cation:proton antiporter [Deltaproteobacteria bacterium]